MEFQLGCYTELVKRTDCLGRFVAICDSTLRDGEQVGVKYDLEEKIRILKILDDAHVSEIQIASLRNPETIAEAKELCSIKRKYSKIEIMSRSTATGWREEMDGISGFNADIMHTLVPLSPRLRGAYGPALDDEHMIQRIREVVSYGKSLGAACFNLSLLDATRTEETLLHKAIDAGIEAGADRICVADTVGCFTPEVMTEFVRKVKDWLPKEVKLRVHVHNDFGLATANALAAAAAGADLIDTCVNGRGKRAGNADMVQVVWGLRAFYGIETGILPEKMYDISKEVERLSGIPIPSNTPFTGELVFADDSEYHIRGLKDDSFAFQAINPTDWGNPRRILIGKNSGPFAMKAKLEQLGIPICDEQVINIILERCIKEATMMPRGQYLSDQNVLEIYRKLMK